MDTAAARSPKRTGYVRQKQGYEKVIKEPEGLKIVQAKFVLGSTSVDKIESGTIPSVAASFPSCLHCAYSQ